MRDSIISYLTGFATLFALLLPAAALAEPGDTAMQSGTAQVVVIEPVGIQNVAELRFGQMLSPSTPGTVVMGPTGVVSETGGMAGNTDVPQTFNGRGPGGFAIFFDTATVANLTTSTPTFTLRNSAGNTMQVRNLTARRFSSGPGFATVTIGATLTVNANQPTGSYTGTYTLNVAYF